MTTATKTAPKTAPKPADKPAAKVSHTLNYTFPEGLGELIDAFMIDPENRADVIAVAGKVAKSDRSAFVTYALRMTFKRLEELGNRKPRSFGTGIDKTVAEIEARNLEVFKTDPENTTGEIRAISPSTLRELHNPNSVKRWMLENADRIEAHHKALGITSVMDYNRKAGKAKAMHDKGA
jgi:hypothetical protein